MLKSEQKRSAQQHTFAKERRQWFWMGVPVTRCCAMSSWILLSCGRSARHMPSSDRARYWRNARRLWVGLQAPAGRMRCAYMEVVHCGRSLRILDTSATLNHIILTLRHAGYCWIPYKRVHGSVGGEVQNPKKRGVSCGLDHKRMRYLCDVRAQRAWSCSHYVVQPS